MKIYSFIFYFFLFLVCSKSVFSQTIIKKDLKIFSLENNEYLVIIKLNSINEKIYFELSPNEIICLSGYRDLIDDVKIIDNHFIEIQFKIRGGTGIKLSRYVLIGISQNKLYKAIDVLSLISSEFKLTYNKEIDSLNIYDERSIYKVTFELNNNKNKYMLIANIYEYVKSKVNPSLNYERENLVVLGFDLKKKIFFNQVGNLNGEFSIGYRNESIEEKENFNNEEFPMIKLNEQEYFYINQSWYIKDSYNHLTKFAIECN